MVHNNPFPKISIITPVYNGSSYLEDLIRSVINQDYPNYEHIIINDGSQDEGKTVAILKRYPHLKWWSRENLGQYATMNEGLIKADGDYVCFISSDDLMAKNAMSRAATWLIEHPEAAGVYGLTTYMDQDGKPINLRFPFVKAPLKYYPYFFQLQHCSFYVSKNALLKNELMFNPEIRYVGDYDWTLRIIKSNIQVGRIGSVLSIIRVHQTQLSSLNRNKIKGKHKALAKQYGFGSLRFRFLIFIFNIGRLLITGSQFFSINRKSNP